MDAGLTSPGQINFGDMGSQQSGNLELTRASSPHCHTATIPETQGQRESPGGRNPAPPIKVLRPVASSALQD